jgi:hypothetical protein
MTALKSANLALAFLLELALLAAFAYWGFHVGSSTLTRWLLGIGIPLIVAGFWGLFMAPKSRRRLGKVTYLIVKVLLFGLAVAALAAAGATVAAFVLAVLFVINTALLYAWE